MAKKKKKTMKKKPLAKSPAVEVCCFPIPTCKKIDVLGLGVSMGVVFALSILLLNLISTQLGLGIMIHELLASIYVGYSTTLAGTIVGSIWAFIDGFIFGALLAYFYNFVVNSR